MKRHAHEQALQNYLINNYGLNLKRINSSLTLIEPEHKFKSGRIDILARNQEHLVGIELKATDYNTREICAQLLNYINYLRPLNGEVYFVAPKIKFGIYSTLKNFYGDNKIKFFEFEKKEENYFFRQMPSDLLDDKRHKPYNLLFDDTHQTPVPFLDEEKIKKGLTILIKDKKHQKLITSLLDTKTSKQKQFENIIYHTINLVFAENKFVKTAYEIFKIL